MTALNIQIFQHVPYEGPVAIEPYFVAMGHSVQVTKLFAQESAEIFSNTDALVVMGGPMSVSDEAKYFWLQQEKEAIAKAVQMNMPVLGICLGAQLLAEVLGAKVSPLGYREIGWFPVKTNKEFLDHPIGNSFPKSFCPLHWHGDAFEIPDSAIALGSSAACANQGFIYGERQIGLQFHLEFDRSSVKRLSTIDANELNGTRFVQSEEQMLSQPNLFVDADRLLSEFLVDFVGLCR